MFSPRPSQLDWCIGTQKIRYTSKGDRSTRFLLYRNRISICLYSIRSFDTPMALIGYWRTSTTEQDAERQIQSLLEAGCEKEMIFGDQITGTSSYGDRPGLSECLKSLRPGDTWVIHELDRAGRSMVGLTSGHARITFAANDQPRRGHKRRVRICRA